MICAIRGELREVGETHVAIETPASGLTYEVLVSRYSSERLAGRAGTQIELQTLEVLEGNLAGANLIPRLIGFRDAAERALFDKLTDIRGISYRRALKIMECAPQDLAAAIERGDIAFLTRLPEIGKKMAAQMVDELRGTLAELVGAVPEPAAASLTAAARTALEVLVAWGDRRADAQMWVTRAMEKDPDQADPQEIVRTAYRLRGSPV